MMDETLLKMLAVYDKVMDIILPTIGEERQKTYSPFLPICQHTGKVLQVPMIARDPAAGTVTYIDPEFGHEVVTPVTGGRVKCQWKADWAMRWAALGVDYEMAGKDLIDSVTLSSKICRALGGTPPEGFNYELFLDEKGEKISKSKGNGITIEEWLEYASPESLSLYMFQKPKSAKKLYFDVIPKTVDEYLTFLAKFPEEAPRSKSTIRRGTFMVAIRRRRNCPCRLRCCSTSSRRRTRKTRRCCGALSSVWRRKPALRPTRCSMNW